MAARSSGSGGAGAADPPIPVRLAGGLLIGQGLCGLAFAGYLLTRASGATLSMRAVLGEAGFFVLLAAATVAVGIGLLRGRSWARTPGVVIQVLLLPVVYSLLGPSRQVLFGAIAGIVVIATLMLLISEPARRWSWERDAARRRG